MKTTGIFFGSSGGVTEEVANKIAEKLGVPGSDVHNVASASPEDVGKYEVLLLGSSTWGAGDLQDDWYDFLPKIQKMDLSNKKAPHYALSSYVVLNTFICGSTHFCGFHFLSLLYID